VFVTHTEFRRAAIPLSNGFGAILKPPLQNLYAACSKS